MPPHIAIIPEPTPPIMLPMPSWLPMPFGKQLDDLIARTLADQVDDGRIIANQVRCDQFVDFLLFLAGIQRGSVCVSVKQMFRNVTKRPVTQVVKQRCQTDKPPFMWVQTQIAGH